MIYLEPDKTWTVFGIKSENDFLNRYMVKGKFHSNVPKEVIKDYEIVERLMFYSYFHYPLIDEAFSKSTRIFESSITIKLENAGLKKDKYESLHSKLTRLKKYCSNDLFEQWKRAKELRNQFAHPKAGVFMGITLMNGFKHNLNMINSIFLESSMITKKESDLSEILKKSSHLLNGKFILEYNNKKFLISNTRVFTTGIIKNSNQSLWVFIPITGNKEILKSSDFPKSFILKLENVKINENGLVATEFNSKDIITLIETDKAENIQKFTDHNQRISTLENVCPEISKEYMILLQHNITKEITNFIYEDW